MKADFFKKAEENLQAAQFCFDHGCYNACANRLYYAALHAAVSALAKRGIRRERIDHDWVQADFSGRLIHRQKVYPAKFKSYLRDLQTVRNIADYTATDVSQKKASRGLVKTKELIECIQEELQR